MSVLRISLLLLVLSQVVEQSAARGVLSIKLLSYENPRGRTYEGQCCDPSPLDGAACHDKCDYVMRLIISGLGRANDHVFLFHRPLKYDSNDLHFQQHGGDLTLTVLFDQWPSEGHVKMNAFFYDYDDFDHTTALVDWFEMELSSDGKAWQGHSDILVNGNRQQDKTRLVFQWSRHCVGGLEGDADCISPPPDWNFWQWEDTDAESNHQQRGHVSTEGGQRVFYDNNAQEGHILKSPFRPFSTRKQDPYLDYSSHSPVYEDHTKVTAGPEDDEYDQYGVRHYSSDARVSTEHRRKSVFIDDPRRIVKDNLAEKYLDNDLTQSTSHSEQNVHETSTEQLVDHSKPRHLSMRPPNVKKNQNVLALEADNAHDDDRRMRRPPVLVNEATRLETHQKHNQEQEVAGQMVRHKESPFAKLAKDSSLSEEKSENTNNVHVPKPEPETPRRVLKAEETTERTTTSSSETSKPETSKPETGRIRSPFAATKKIADIQRVVNTEIKAAQDLPVLSPAEQDEAVTQEQRGKSELRNSKYVESKSPFSPPEGHDSKPESPLSPTIKSVDTALPVKKSDSMEQSSHSTRKTDKSHGERARDDVSVTSQRENKKTTITTPPVRSTDSPYDKTTRAGDRHTTTATPSIPIITMPSTVEEELTRKRIVLQKTTPRPRGWGPLQKNRFVTWIPATPAAHWVPFQHGSGKEHIPAILPRLHPGAGLKPGGSGAPKAEGRDSQPANPPQLGQHHPAVSNNAHPAPSHPEPKSPYPALNPVDSKPVRPAQSNLEPQSSNPIPSSVNLMPSHPAPSHPEPKPQNPAPRHTTSDTRQHVVHVKENTKDSMEIHTQADHRESRPTHPSEPDQGTKQRETTSVNPQLPPVHSMDQVKPNVPMQTKPVQEKAPGKQEKDLDSGRNIEDKKKHESAVQSAITSNDVRQERPQPTVKSFDGDIFRQPEKSAKVNPILLHKQQQEWLKKMKKENLKPLPPHTRLRGEELVKPPPGVTTHRVPENKLETKSTTSETITLTTTRQQAQNGHDHLTTSGRGFSSTSTVTTISTITPHSRQNSGEKTTTISREGTRTLTTTTVSPQETAVRSSSHKPTGSKAVSADQIAAKDEVTSTTTTLSVVDEILARHLDLVRAIEEADKAQTATAPLNARIQSAVKVVTPEETDVLKKTTTETEQPRFVQSMTTAPYTSQRELATLSKKHTGQVQLTTIPSSHQFDKTDLFASEEKTTTPFTTVKDADEAEEEMDTSSVRAESMKRIKTQTFQTPTKVMWYVTTHPAYARTSPPFRPHYSDIEVQRKDDDKPSKTSSPQESGEKKYSVAKDSKNRSPFAQPEIQVETVVKQEKSEEKKRRKYQPGLLKSRLDLVSFMAHPTSTENILSTEKNIETTLQLRKSPFRPDREEEAVGISLGTSITTELSAGKEKAKPSRQKEVQTATEKPMKSPFEPPQQMKSSDSTALPSTMSTSRPSWQKEVQTATEKPMKSPFEPLQQMKSSHSTFLPSTMSAPIPSWQKEVQTATEKPIKSPFEPPQKTSDSTSLPSTMSTSRPSVDEKDSPRPVHAEPVTKDTKEQPVRSPFASGRSSSDRNLLTKTSQPSAASPFEPSTNRVRSSYVKTVTEQNLKADKTEVRDTDTQATERDASFSTASESEESSSRISELLDVGVNEVESENSAGQKPAFAGSKGSKGRGMGRFRNLLKEVRKLAPSDPSHKNPFLNKDNGSPGTFILRQSKGGRISSLYTSNINGTKINSSRVSTDRLIVPPLSESAPKEGGKYGEGTEPRREGTTIPDTNPHSPVKTVADIRRVLTDSTPSVSDTPGLLDSTLQMLKASKRERGQQKKNEPQTYSTLPTSSASSKVTFQTAGHSESPRTSPATERASVPTNFGDSSIKDLSSLAPKSARQTVNTFNLGSTTASRLVLTKERQSTTTTTPNFSSTTLSPKTKPSSSFLSSLQSSPITSSHSSTTLSRAEKTTTHEKNETPTSQTEQATRSRESGVNSAAAKSPPTNSHHRLYTVSTSERSVTEPRSLFTKLSTPDNPLPSPHSYASSESTGSTKGERKTTLMTVSAKPRTNTPSNALRGSPAHETGEESRRPSEDRATSINRTGDLSFKTYPQEVGSTSPSASDATAVLSSRPGDKQNTTHSASPAGRITSKHSTTLLPVSESSTTSAQLGASSTPTQKPSESGSATSAHGSFDHTVKDEGQTSSDKQDGEIHRESWTAEQKNSTSGLNVVNVTRPAGSEAILASETMSTDPQRSSSGSTSKSLKLDEVSPSTETPSTTAGSVRSPKQDAPKTKGRNALVSLFNDLASIISSSIATVRNSTSEASSPQNEAGETVSVSPKFFLKSSTTLPAMTILSGETTFRNTTSSLAQNSSGLFSANVSGKPILETTTLHQNFTKLSSSRTLGNFTTDSSAASLPNTTEAAASAAGSRSLPDKATILSKESAAGKSSPTTKKGADVVTRTTSTQRTSSVLQTDSVGNKSDSESHSTTAVSRSTKSYTSGSTLVNGTASTVTSPVQTNTTVERAESSKSTSTTAGLSMTNATTTEQQVNTSTGEIISITSEASPLNTTVNATSTETMTQLETTSEQMLTTTVREKTKSVVKKSKAKTTTTPAVTSTTEKSATTAPTTFTTQTALSKLTTPKKLKLILPDWITFPNKFKNLQQGMAVKTTSPTPPTTTTTPFVPKTTPKSSVKSKGESLDSMLKAIEDQILGRNQDTKTVEDVNSVDTAKPQEAAKNKDSAKSKETAKFRPTVPSLEMLLNVSEAGPKVIVPKDGLYKPEFNHHADLSNGSYGSDFSGSRERHVGIHLQKMSVGTVFNRYWPAILGLTVGTVFLVVALLTSIACRQQRLFIQRRHWQQDTPQHLTEPPDTSEYSSSSASSLVSDNTRSSINFT